MSSIPRVLLAIDRPGWAFDHIAQTLIRHLGHEFDFSVGIQDRIVEGETDMVVVFWWGYASLLRANLKVKRVLTCLYDGHSWTTEDGMRQFRLNYLQSDLLAVANEALARIIPWSIKPVTIIEDGVDTELFRPTGQWPEEFAVGWVGNSSHGASRSSSRGIKGLELIVEACDRAGVRLITLDVAGRQGRARKIAFEQMPDWYSKISAYVCASSCEGTPNPVLEAMACGRPVITTNVGLVRRVVINERNGYVVNRCVDSIVDALTKLKDHHDLHHMGKLARLAAEAHDWRSKISYWRTALWTALS
jgi:glycosyltransferase involved in cell wall biosynthesis